VLCEELLRNNFSTTLISIGAAIVVLLVILITWDLTKSHIATKFINLSDVDRMKYMLKVARAVDLGHQMERRLERDAVAAQMPPAQFAAEKGSMRSQSNYEYI
jgi:hypothetical protein